MALVPEFFILLGVVVFLATSLVSALVGEEVPSILQYLFQAAGAAGLSLLFLGQGAIGIGGFWTGIIYLSAAASSLVAVNVYLAVVKRNDALSSILTGVLTVPTFAASAVLIASYLGTGGELILTPAVVVILSVAAVAIMISMSGFIPESYLHIVGLSHGSPEMAPVLVPIVEQAGGLPSVPLETERNGWEESSGEQGSRVS